MKIYDMKGTQLSAVYKTKQPMFSHSFGRTWEVVEITINDEKVKMYLDTSLGVNGYFQMNGQWYKTNLVDLFEFKNIWYASDEEMTFKME